MSDQVSGNDRLALRRYLLGTASPEAGDEIEDRFAEDEAFFTAYKQVKQELVVEFAAGRMTADEAACFERSYLTSAQRQREVSVVKALLSVQAEPPPLRTAWLSLNRRLVFASCLSVLAIAMGISWNFLHPGGATKTPSESVRNEARVQKTPPPMPLEPTPAAALERRETKSSEPVGVPFASSAPVTPLAEAAPTQVRENSIPGGTLEQQLQSRYALTQLTADNTDIVSMGSVLILKKERFSAVMAASDNPPPYNIYKDGQISTGAALPARRFGSLPGTGYMPGGGSAAGNAVIGAAASRDFVNGETLYVTKITVDRAKDTIVFDLISDPYGDAGRYRASLRFELPKGSTASSDLAQIQPIIEQVFEIKPASDQNAVAPAGPPTPIDIVGQTRDRVVSLLGRPRAIIRAGTREVYLYADVKLTFVNGKVTDAQ